VVHRLVLGMTKKAHIDDSYNWGISRSIVALGEPKAGTITSLEHNVVARELQALAFNRACSAQGTGSRRWAPPTQIVVLPQ